MSQRQSKATFDARRAPTRALELFDRSYRRLAPLPARRVFSILVVLLAAGCTPRNAYEAPPPPGVTVQTPTRQDVTDYWEQTGQLAATQSIDIVARIEGFLTSIGYKDGDGVAKGTTLFTVEPAPYKASVDRAQANLAGAQAQAAYANLQFARFRTLAKTDTVSQAQAQDYQTQLASANASVQQMQAALEQAQITYSYTNIQAPFAGRVSAHMQDVGALVGSGGTTQLATLVQTDPIWVNFNLSEADALKARSFMNATGRGQADIRKVPVEVGLQNEQGYPRQGSLDYVAPSIDPGTGTLAARATLANKDGALMPGAFVRVRIPVSKVAGALLVPDVALGNVQGTPTLLVVDDKNVVSQRSVTLGSKQGDLRVVTQGVGPNDRIIVDGVGRVMAGETVAPKDAPQAAPAPAAPQGGQPAPGATP